MKGGQKIDTQTIDYRDEHTLLQAYVAYEDLTKQKRSIVLIAYAWRGRDDFIEKKGRHLAELGYVDFAMDVYGKRAY
ncbi:dienelactone hydrolase family protein [Candidatus Coxiella mudrowiae]|uniref:dienelactone hydrolase family protein n=1 Tax=Candidatus Coxiella mudrowiae TaxID=2054173 RepID=UPI001F296F75|nr:dienelactone hydrolase family protein [Candidatus Coxiella mudrowiae]